MNTWKKLLHVDRVHLEFIANASRYIPTIHFMTLLKVQTKYILHIITHIIYAASSMSLIYRSPVHANLKESYAELVTENFPLQYGNYNDLCGVLHKYCKTRDTILIADRAWTKKGESFLIEDLYDAGYQYVVGVETTENNIGNLREKNKDKRPEMKFVKGKLQELKVSRGAIIFSNLPSLPHVKSLSTPRIGKAR